MCVTVLVVNRCLFWYACYGVSRE